MLSAEDCTMRKSRYSDSQIMAILEQAEAGTPVPELCREHGMSSALFYKWRSKFGGMDASMIKRLKELEAENARLETMYADVQLQNEVIREACQRRSKNLTDGGVKVDHCGGQQKAVTGSVKVVQFVG